MPKVELIGGRSVALNPIPAPFDRRTPSPNEFGAQFGQQVQRLGDVLSAHAIKSQNDANQVAAIAADNALQSFIQRREFDPDTGYLSEHGEEVWQLPERAAFEVNQEADRIFGTLSNERVRQSFLVARGNAMQSLDMRLRRHVLKEMEAQDISMSQAAIDIATNGAINNALSPEFIRPEIDKIVATRRDFGKRWGINEKIVDAQISEDVSLVHVGVITRLLQLGNDTQANDYFQLVGPGSKEDPGADEINGTALGKVEAALKEGTLRGITQQTVDQIMATTDTDAEARAAAREIENPELREAAERDVEIRLNRNEADRQEERRAIELTALNAIDDNPSLGKKAVDPTAWANMDGAARMSLERYAEQQAPGGGGTDTDAGTYYLLFRQAHGISVGGDPRTPEEIQAEFGKFDLMTVRHLLDEVDWERLVGLQGQIALGKKSTDEVFTDGRSQTQIFNGAIDSAGIKRTGTLSTKSRKFLGELNRQHAAAIVRWQEDNGKKADNPVKQQLIDDLLIEVATGDAGFGVGIPFIGQFFEGDTARVSEVLSTLTPAEIAAYRAALVKAEMQPSDVNVAKSHLLK